jgi:uncharacterized protein with GYD domain
MAKQKPGDHWREKRSHDATVTPALSNLGISKSQSSHMLTRGSWPLSPVAARPPLHGRIGASEPRQMEANPMPVFVSMGRYTESAIKGLLAKPEDRTAVVKNMVEQAGGKLLAWYMLFGEYDWITVYEMPSGKEAAATMLAVAGAGVVTDMRTMLAMTGAEAKAAFEAGKKLGAGYRPPGTA